MAPSGASCFFFRTCVCICETSLKRGLLWPTDTSRLPMPFFLQFVSFCASPPAHPSIKEAFCWGTRFSPSSAPKSASDSVGFSLFCHCEYERILATTRLSGERIPATFIGLGNELWLHSHLTESSAFRNLWMCGWNRHMAKQTIKDGWWVGGQACTNKRPVSHKSHWLVVGAVTTHNSQWGQRVKAHYTIDKCMVLSKLFPLASPNGAKCWYKPTIYLLYVLICLRYTNYIPTIYLLYTCYMC